MSDPMHQHSSAVDDCDHHDCLPECVEAAAALPHGAPLPEGGCPPPLNWKQVLAETERLAARWEVARPGYRIRGWSFGTGRPLYLLNGWIGDSRLFSLLAWLLRDDFRCVLYDYPEQTGRGRLLIPRWSALADDLLAVADAHGDARFDVCAHSFGTAVALRTALDSPGRMGRLVLQGAFARRQLSVCERMLAALCRWLPGTAASVPARTRLQAINQVSWFPPFDRSRWEFYLENTGAASLAALAVRGRLLRRWDVRNELAGLQSPVVLVATEGQGHVTAALQSELEALLPQVTSEWLVNCGQIPFLTHPHRMASLIRERLADRPDDGAGSRVPAARTHDAEVR